jgi:MptA/FolE2 family GTP cyclohydrolase
MIDIQSAAVTPRFVIEAVGVTGLKYPMVARDGVTGVEQGTTAEWRLSVALPASRRGTHMSRFIEALEARAGSPMDLDGHFAFTQELTKRLDAGSAEATTTFTWFRTVRAPVSGLAGRLESTVTFTSRTGADAAKTLRVQVAAKALCPCSKAISERGAHNQRADIRVTLRFPATAPVPAIDQVLALAEAGASSPVYPLLKREDEKHITESAYDNPVFVEDLVRNIAACLIDIPGAGGFVVEVVNRESIHAHDCFARITHERA